MNKPGTPITHDEMRDELPSEILCALERQITFLRDLYGNPAYTLPEEDTNWGLRRAELLQAFRENYNTWLPGFDTLLADIYPKEVSSDEAL